MAGLDTDRRLTLQQGYAEAAQAGVLSGYRKRRWGRSEEFAVWLEQPALGFLDRGQALALYRASGGRKTKAFSAFPIEELRDSLDFLLYDTIKLEGRFDECGAPDGAYTPLGAGKEFASYLLCLRQPRLLGVWNGNSERLLRRLGLETDTMKHGPIGIRYLDVLDALGRVGSEFGWADFLQVDELAYFVARVQQRAP